MSNMKVTVWFRWESGMNLMAVSLLDIFINHLLNKILRDSLVFHNFLLVFQK